MPHVDLGRGADALLLLGNGHEPLLNTQVVERDLDPQLGNAILHVVGCQVGQQRHQGVVVRFDRGIQRGVGRLHLPAVFAPEIELPVQIEARKIEVKRVAGESAGGIGPHHFLALREDVPHGDGLLCPCLQHPSADRAEARVLLVSSNNERVQQGILKDLPPVAIAGRGALGAGILRLDPFLGHGRRRPAIVGTDLEAVVNVVHEAGRHAPAVDEGRTG